jgi:hypothetical protein
MNEEQNISEESNQPKELNENIEQPQISNMEVHKHPHHVTHKKKWPEYLLEFVMIFLAVFLGFVAENVREGIQEKHREKQFMASLVKDLVLDTSELSKADSFRLQKIRALDSTINILAVQNTPLVSLMIYNLTKKFYGSINFFQNSGTLDQLKNSGGLRLINNRKIVDFIEAYDQQVRRMTKRDDYENEAFVYSSRLAQKLFDARSIIKTLGTSNNVKAIPDSTISIKLNLTYLDEYLNNLMNYEFLIKNNLGVFETNKQTASNLIQLIKKEYNLENE